MHQSFFISDPHFGHSNIITFKDKEGNLVRPFSSIEEMDELIVENINKVVRKVDTLYLMGDIVINRRCLPILNRLIGRKKLLCGNHDIFHLKDYSLYFEEIHAYKVYPEHGIIFSHIPIHPMQLTDRFSLNCHGHLHQNEVWTIRDGNDYSDIDKRYMNLCCEKINYTPISLEEIIEKKKLL